MTVLKFMNFVRLPGRYKTISVYRVYHTYDIPIELTPTYTFIGDNKNTAFDIMHKAYNECTSDNKDHILLINGYELVNFDIMGDTLNLYVYGDSLDETKEDIYMPDENKGLNQFTKFIHDNDIIIADAISDGANGYIVSNQFTISESTNKVYYYDKDNKRLSMYILRDNDSDDK